MDLFIPHRRVKRPRDPKPTFEVLIGRLGLEGKRPTQLDCPGLGVVLPISDPSVSGLPSLLHGGLTNCLMV